MILGRGFNTPKVWSHGKFVTLWNVILYYRGVLVLGWKIVKHSQPTLFGSAK
jgi:hypothetical protein